ncbi:MAG: cysteine hydrolase [Ignavibacteriaceae bacterium]|jgi:nicotinamidase-related amidase|nr:cysteine hydrolase [Ignavibacteriaceae bacterium]
MSFNFIPEANLEVPELKFEKQVSLDTEKTALIVVDMQNDFVRDDGNLYVPAAKETIKNVKELIDEARKKNVRVVYTQDTHFDGDKEWEIWPVHCKKGSNGWKIIDEIKPAESEMVFEKNRYDGFYETQLEHYLSHVWGIENLVIVGTVSSICVLHTAASAGLRWYHLVIPADGISALTDFDQAMTLRQVSFLYAGKIVKSCDDISFG